MTTRRTRDEFRDYWWRLARLTAAYELSKTRHKVALFEKEAELGGQAAIFQVTGERLERFYHQYFSSK